MAILMRHRQLDKERACYIARLDAIRIWLEYVTKLLLIDVRTFTPIHGFSN